jgi:hypothetical protein
VLLMNRSSWEICPSGIILLRSALQMLPGTIVL